MTITTNAAQVIKQLKAYAQNLDAKMHTLMEKLAEVGLDVANTRYATAQYDGLPSDEPIGPTWVGDDTLEIGYSGSTILFIEFGTGVTYTEQHPLAGEFGYERGGYGYHLGKLSSWRYVGSPGTNGQPDPDHPGWIRTEGNPPNRVLYDASKEMRTKIQEIAKEVFHS